MTPILHAMVWRDERGETASAATASGESSGRPVFLLAAGRMVAFAATFATPLVLARVFDQADFGTYKQLFVVYTTLVGIAQFGMAESLLYFLPFSPRRGGRYVVNALLVLAGAGLACLGLLALAGPHLSRWLGNAALPGLSGLLGAYLLFMLPATVLELVMTARKRYLGAAVAYGLSDLLRAIAIVAPAVVFGRLEMLLAGAVVFGGVRLGATLLYLRREFGGRLTPAGGVLREQLTYALPLQLGVVLWVLALNLHYYAVAASVSAATFAIYAVGCLQIPLFDFVMTPAVNVMMVRMREALTAHRPDAVAAIWHDTTRRLALVYFPLVGLLLVTGRELILLLFTARYAASVPIFLVYTAGYVFAMLQTDGVLRAYADTRAIAILYAIQLVLIAGLVPAFMAAFGIIGAVLATAFTGGVVGKSLALVRVKRLMGVALAGLLPWRSLGEISGAAAVAALAALAIKAHLAAAPLPLLVATSCVYAATYFGILMARGRLDTGPGQVLGVRG
jgi:O-antigen/teichoic acid export membrane protein